MIESVDCSTLGWMLDNGDELHVVCMNGPCSHGAMLSVQGLMELLGREHSSLHIDIVTGLRANRMRLRCSVCGGYEISFRRLPGTYTGHPGLDKAS